MTSFAHRMSNVRAEGAYQVLARAQELERQGRHIIHLEIGQPDFQTFEAICQAGKQAIDEGHTRYTPSAGVRGLREAIAQHISATKGPCSPSQVVVGPGAKPGILFPILALVNPGDEVLYPDPGFPSYRADIELAGGVPIAAPLLEARGFSFDLDFLADHMGDKTKLLRRDAGSSRGASGAAHHARRGLHGGLYADGGHRRARAMS
jgi:aspartate/methionine/tyrosine aminotransferase